MASNDNEESTSPKNLADAPPLPVFIFHNLVETTGKARIVANPKRDLTTSLSYDMGHGLLLSNTKAQSTKNMRV